MKKMLSLAVSGVLGAGMLVAATSEASTAGDTPYPGSINTKCIGKRLGRAVVNEPTNVRFRVGTKGNGPASGDVHFTYTRRKTGEVVADDLDRKYTGPKTATYVFHRMPRGLYWVRMTFTPTPEDSVFTECSGRFRQRVNPS